MVLNDLITSGSKAFPRKPALVCGKELLTYQQLEREVNRLAAGLAELDVKFGDRIAIFLRNRPQFVTAYFAILRLGAIPVPLNHMWKEEELHFVLADSGVRLIFTEKEFLETSLSLQRRLESLNKVVLLDGHTVSSANIIAYRDLCRTEPKKPFPITAGSDVAVLIYTSGTTGFPKGVMLTHENLLANIESCRKAVALYPKDRFYCILPMFHSFSFTVSVLIPLSLGSTIFILPKLVPFRKLTAEIIRRRITIFVGIPDFYQVLSGMKASLVTRLIFRLVNPVRLAISGAATLPPETLSTFERRLRIPLLEGYGLTEAAPVVTLNPPGKAKPGSIGVPVPGCEVKVVSEDGKELPVGQVGEVVVKGKNVMAGYYNRSEDTREVLKGGWLYTGDLGKKDEEGYFYLVDRKKDMINFRGENIYPREIETVLYRHPEVKEAAVVGERSPAGEIPIAYVVLKEGAKADHHELQDYLRRYLATYKLPRRIIFKTELPHTATGKISKKDLRGMK